MFKRTKLSMGALVALGTLSAMPSMAQDAAQRVEVTGSNIRRIASETAAPIQTVTREDIARSGKGSIAELLQTLSVDNQGSVPTTFGNGFAAGASGISLRGMGAASTLVLVNGRRIAPYGLADDGQKVFADLNVIPLEAVDRVEILLDGASAIYGSDAIAGVVNIVLRKDFNGAVIKANVGQSRYGDGKTASASVTAGFGDLTRDRYNVLFNFEASKKGEIWNRDRSDRGAVGRADLRDLGLDANSGFGGTGAITLNAAGDPVGGGSAINGNVRNPATAFYYNRGNLLGAGFNRTFAGANCANFTSHAQGDPGNGCLVDGAQAYGQIQPSQNTLNFFTRGSILLSADTQVYAELNLYQGKSTSYGTPSGVSASTGYPGGPVANNTIALGAAHPDNPYFGAAARIRYLANDVGPRVSDITSDFTRLVIGAKGRFGEWDYDTAFLSTGTKVSNSRTGYLQRDATFALLNPTGVGTLRTLTANSVAAASTNAAYAALPAGTYWRIAENAGLNSAAMYAALSPTISNDAKSQTTQLDFKVNGELGQLAGGALGVAAGVEFRRESIRLDPTAGTERGNIIGLGYSAYDGSRNVTAVYAELSAPVLQGLELSAAVRMDRYSDAGTSTTPKLGLKWTPAKMFSMRGTYSEGFRAPSSAENGTGGLAAFTTAIDPARCRLGVTTACSQGNVAIITSPNPTLSPEKSKAYTLGLVFDPQPGTSITLDLWEIQRRNEINQEASAAAISAGHVARDATSAQVGIAGDPGPIIAILANYVNSNKSTVRGVDFDAKQSFNLGGGTKLGVDLKWTHLLKWVRTEQDGSTFDYAGTHGNCDVTNCIGTPADRFTLTFSFETGPVRVAANVMYRAAIKNINYRGEANCADSFADGRDAPAYCEVKAFTSTDLTMRWAFSQNLELSGAIVNLFDTKPPLDLLTYGAVSYNPLDYSGAVGRYFKLGMRYKF